MFLGNFVIISRGKKEREEIVCGLDSLTGLAVELYIFVFCTITFFFFFQFLYSFSIMLCGYLFAWD